MRPPVLRSLLAGGAVPLLALTLAAPSTGAVLPTAATPRTAATADLRPVEGAVTALDSVAGHKSAGAALARTPRWLLDRDDDEIVHVLVKLDHDGAASYAGGVEGLAATSPRVTGRKLTGASVAERAYTAYQERNEAEAKGALRATVPAATVGESLRAVYGGFAATLPASSVEDVLAIDGVVAVQPDELRQPLTDSSSDFIDATQVQAALGGAADAGEGLIYGNLDTGVWPEHPSFADQGHLGAPPGSYTCDFGDNPLTAQDDPFVCNNKLIGGYAFLDTYLSSPTRAAAEPYHSARDSAGHGTHTASTSAGNVLDEAVVLGVDRGPVRGIAPGAWVVEYKVCGIVGCFASDSAAAVEQAVLDGVDVINFSISGGTDPYTDPVELAFLDAYEAGVFVSASAGNSGPGAATANHLSPWVTTVGASTQTREFGTTLTLDADGTTFTVDGVTITAGAGPLPVVLSSAAPYSNELCTAPAAPGTFTGMIVACQRGTNARVEKGYNVLQGGAAGMILYNPRLADVETDNHWLPTVHVADGTELEAFLAAHSGVVGRFAAGESRPGQGDVMAAFSSRGPAGLFVKPDVTAPGVQILAGMTPTPESPTNGPEGQYFQAIAGTSMSSPHVAGAALLVRASHPAWSPGQVKSALMTSSVTEVVKEDLATPADPFDRGAGRIDVDDAAAVVLTLDESAARFRTLGGNELTAVDLNLPSINAPTMPGRLTTTRTVTNTSSVVQRVKVTTQAPSDSRVTVTPSSFALQPGQAAQLKVTLSSTAPLGAQRFATIHLRPGKGGALHLPVAFVHTQGEVALTQECDDTTLAVGDTTTCTVEATNLGPEPHDVTVGTTVSKKLRVTGAEDATVTGPRTVITSATLAGNLPGVPSVAPGALFGYIPLSAFGIAPIALGDEHLLNFSVPAFGYNGRTFDALGVDSNGYVVVGGGGAEDNNCCTLPPGPDAAPPNNVLAPFWTDLDGTGAPGLRIAVLTDGTTSWIVVEHQVNVFGTTDLRAFQTWIGTGAAQDITYAYDVPQADPAGQDFLVGAENSLGQGDMESVLPTEDLRVTSTPATPGGTLTYAVDVRAQDDGLGTVTSTLTSPTVPGTTVVTTTITLE